MNLTKEKVSEMKIIEYIKIGIIVGFISSAITFSADKMLEEFPSFDQVKMDLMK